MNIVFSSIPNIALSNIAYMSAQVGHTQAPRADPHQHRDEEEVSVPELWQTVQQPPDHNQTSEEVCSQDQRWGERNTV